MLPGYFQLVEADSNGNGGVNGMKLYSGTACCRLSGGVSRKFSSTGLIQVRPALMWQGIQRGVI